MEIYDLLQCVDRALDSFGSNAKQATYWSLMSKEGISSDRILSKPEAFVRALREVFGSGYVLIEKSIVKEINSSFDLGSSADSYGLIEALDAASRDITGGYSESLMIAADH